MAAAVVAAAVDDDDAVAAAFAAVSAVDDDDVAVAVVADIADIAVVAYAVVVVVAYVVAAAGVAGRNGVVEFAAALLFVQSCSTCAPSVVETADTCDRILAYSYQPLLRENCDICWGWIDCLVPISNDRFIRLISPAGFMSTTS